MAQWSGFAASGRMGAVDQVIAYIQHAVKSGVYTVGDKLPNEAELAAAIGVGRSSLREGMRTLAAYGIVEIRQGDGTFVIDKTSERFFDFLGYIPSSNFQDFVDLRRVIETGTIASVCGKLTEEDFLDLENINRVLDYRNGLEACVRADREFHVRIMHIVETPLVLQIEKLIYETRSEFLYKTMCYRDVVESAHSDHLLILEALRSEDVCACVQAVMRHMDAITWNIERLGVVRSQ